MTNLERFKNLVQEQPSSFLTDFEYHKKNKEWLDRSADIAVNILQSIRDKGWTQKKLAEKLDVSPQQVNKIVKGKENLTLETISKIETVLDVDLIKVNKLESINNIEPIITENVVPRNDFQFITFDYLHTDFKELLSKQVFKEESKIKDNYSKPETKVRRLFDAA